MEGESNAKSTGNKGPAAQEPPTVGLWQRPGEMGRLDPASEVPAGCKKQHVISLACPWISPSWLGWIDAFTTLDVVRIERYASRSPRAECEACLHPKVCTIRCQQCSASTPRTGDQSWKSRLPPGCEPWTSTTRGPSWTAWMESMAGVNGCVQGRVVEEPASLTLAAPQTNVCLLV